MLEPDHNKKHPTEAEIDEALKESFPASDPPAWTLGIEQPDPPQEEDAQEEEANDSNDRSNNPS